MQRPTTIQTVAIWTETTFLYQDAVLICAGFTVTIQWQVVNGVLRSWSFVFADDRRWFEDQPVLDQLEIYQDLMNPIHLVNRLAEEILKNA